ncbi:MAG: hypothetical protein JJU16_03500 [Alkalibacterium sp.]|nr:hypothetical protein [Alkalibacterium sp.]
MLIGEAIGDTRNAFAVGSGHDELKKSELTNLKRCASSLVLGETQYDKLCTSVRIFIKKP